MRKNLASNATLTRHKTTQTEPKARYGFEIVIDAILYKREKIGDKMYLVNHDKKFAIHLDISDIWNFDSAQFVSSLFETQLSLSVTFAFSYPSKSDQNYLYKSIDWF